MTSHWLPIEQADKTKTYDVWDDIGQRWINCTWRGHYWRDEGSDATVLDPVWCLEITPPVAEKNGASVTDAMVEAAWDAFDKLSDRDPLEWMRGAIEAALRAAETKEAGK